MIPEDLLGLPLSQAKALLPETGWAIEEITAPGRERAGMDLRVIQVKEGEKGLLITVAGFPTDISGLEAFAKA